MSTKPPNFSTVILELGMSAVDLTDDERFLPWPPDTAEYEGVGTVSTTDQHDYSTREIFAQCIEGAAKWRETDAAPASLAEDGHLLAKGDAVVVRITRRAIGGARGFWLWRAENPTKVAVSPAAPAPMRDGTYDNPIEAA